MKKFWIRIMKTWRTRIFKKKARDYWQVNWGHGGALNVFYYSMDLFFQGLFSTVCSVVMLVPFLKIVLVRTGSSFWESPWLALALLGVMVACAAALLVVGHFYQKQITNITI